VGLLDYYKQFQGLSEEEVSDELRKVSAERRQKALATLEPIDLSTTTWPELPPSDVVNAVTYVARRGLHRYLDPHAGELRAEIADMLGLEPRQVVVGNGAAQLMSAAIVALMEPNDELVTPWPSYPLYPLMARRAHGHAVPVPGWGPEAVLRALNERTRVVTICNPNDPTGAYLAADELDALLGELPERVVPLVDEALIDFVDAGGWGSNPSLTLLDRHPRLLIFRSFSKAWGLAGLRCGYALGSVEAEPLLERLEPELGIGDVAQAGALQAVHLAERYVPRRVNAVREQRVRLVAELRELGCDVPDTQANTLWIAKDGLDGAELAHRLERGHVIVAGGARYGDPTRVRAAVQDKIAADRLLQAASRHL
jgi:histidinol-phosphate aminotransferase